MSEVLRDLVVIEPHQLVYREFNNGGEGEGMRMAGESEAATADERLTWSESAEAVQGAEFLRSSLDHKKYRGRSPLTNHSSSHLDEG